MQNKLSMQLFLFVSVLLYANRGIMIWTNNAKLFCQVVLLNQCHPDKVLYCIKGLRRRRKEEDYGLYSSSDYTVYSVFSV